MNIEQFRGYRYLTYYDVIEDGMLNWVLLQEVMNNIVEFDLMSKDKVLARDILYNNLKIYGRYLSSYDFYPNFYLLDLLHVYSHHCFNYAICLYNLKEYNQAFDVFVLSVAVNPRRDESFVNQCNGLLQRCALKMGKIMTTNIQDSLSKSLDYNFIRNEIHTALSRGTLPS